MQHRRWQWIRLSRGESVVNGPQLIEQNTAGEAIVHHVVLRDTKQPFIVRQTHQMCPLNFPSLQIKRLANRL
jgi:hypothetical protein